VLSFVQSRQRARVGTSTDPTRDALNSGGIAKGKALSDRDSEWTESELYRPKRNLKRFPELQWTHPDRIFFACVACHILAHAFLRRPEHSRFRAIWTRPANGSSGNHVIATDGEIVFDFHGYSRWPDLLAHAHKKNRVYMSGWSCALIELPQDVLISEAKSLTYDGLHLREPGQFLHDPLPRADAFIDRVAQRYDQLTNSATA